MSPVTKTIRVIIGTILVIIGLIGGSYIGLGFTNMLIMFIFLQAIVTVFSLITLPVEFDARRRALVWLHSSGITNDQELTYANDALKWAASTYVVGALAAVTYLLYYISILKD